jgi:hypothetical protein
MSTTDAARSVADWLSGHLDAQREMFIYGSYINPYYKTWMEAFCMFTRGDRVRIKEGYSGVGNVYYYVGRCADEQGMVEVNVYTNTNPPDDAFAHRILADAIEPYPYTREERIERAIEDVLELSARYTGERDAEAALFAILDAGI